MYLVMLVSGLLILFVFGSESGRLGLESHVLGIESIAKINVHRSWISHDFRVS